MIHAIFHIDENRRKDMDGRSQELTEGLFFGSGFFRPHSRERLNQHFVNEPVGSHQNIELNDLGGGIFLQKDNPSRNDKACSRNGNNFVHTIRLHSMCYEGIFENSRKIEDQLG